MDEADAKDAATPQPQMTSNDVAAAAHRRSQAAAATIKSGSSADTAAPSADPSSSGRTTAGDPGQQQPPVDSQQQQLPASCDAAKPAAEQPASKRERPDCSEEAARRAKLRKRHEAAVAQKWRPDLQRRLAEVSAELEVLQNEFNRIRALWIEPPQPEQPLTAAQRAQLSENAEKRVAEVLAKPCAAALKSLMSHKWAYPFNQPVDTQRYDNYLQYVSRPMDFGSVKKKLEAGEYRDPADVAADIRQVFANAFAFNPPESNVSVMATHLQKLFEDRWANTVTSRVTDAAASARNEEVAAVRAAAEAAQAARTEGLVARAEVVVAALDALGHRMAEALSIAAAHCDALSLEEKDALARAIGGLQESAFGAAMALLVGRAPELHPGGSDMIIDMDRLDALTLRQLQSFVAAANATPADRQVVWPGLTVGAGVKGHKLPHMRAASRSELNSGDSADRRTPSGPSPRPPTPAGLQHAQHAQQTQHEKQAAHQVPPQQRPPVKQEADVQHHQQQQVCESVEQSHLAAGLPQQPLKSEAAAAAQSGGFRLPAAALTLNALLAEQHSPAGAKELGATLLHTHSTKHERHAATAVAPAAIVSTMLDTSLEDAGDPATMALAAEPGSGAAAADSARASASPAQQAQHARQVQHTERGAHPQPQQHHQVLPPPPLPQTLQEALKQGGTSLLRLGGDAALAAADAAAPITAFNVSMD